MAKLTNVSTQNFHDVLCAPFHVFMLFSLPMKRRKIISGRQKLQKLCSKQNFPNLSLSSNYHSPKSSVRAKKNLRCTRQHMVRTMFLVCPAPCVQEISQTVTAKCCMLRSRKSPCANIVSNSK